MGNDRNRVEEGRVLRETTETLREQARILVGRAGAPPWFWLFTPGKPYRWFEGNV